MKIEAIVVGIFKYHHAKQYLFHQRLSIVEDHNISYLVFSNYFYIRSRSCVLAYNDSCFTLFGGIGLKVLFSSLFFSGDFLSMLAGCMHFTFQSR